MLLTPLLVSASLGLHAFEPPIVRRHDRPDREYRRLASRFVAVGAIGHKGTGTLIAPTWVITAAHVVRDGLRGKPTIRFGATHYAIVEVYLHPDWRGTVDHDVALLRLARPVTSVQPLPLYTGELETDQSAILVGYGITGAGDGFRHNDDDIRRAATNTVDSVTAASVFFSFDEPPHGTDLEGAPGAGDSGGPALLVIGDTTFIGGVSSAGFDGTMGPASYGAIDVYTRVSTHLDWIRSVMAEATPSTDPVDHVSPRVGGMLSRELLIKRDVVDPLAGWADVVSRDHAHRFVSKPLVELLCGAAATRIQEHERPTTLPGGRMESRHEPSADPLPSQCAVDEQFLQLGSVPRVRKRRQSELSGANDPAVAERANEDSRPLAELRTKR
jgi:trypsin